MATSRDESHAWLNFSEGKGKKAVQLLRPIAARQERIGKGEVELPAREMLLRMGRPQEALAEYVRSLQADPNRFGGLYGAARAAEIAKQPQIAARYYKRLLANCANGMGPRRAEIARAKVYIAAAGNWKPAHPYRCDGMRAASVFGPSSETTPITHSASTFAELSRSALFPEPDTQDGGGY
jgi:tetratricopeptide (TPR) repeat protein